MQSQTDYDDMLTPLIHHAIALLLQLSHMSTAYTRGHPNEGTAKVVPCPLCYCLACRNQVEIHQMRAGSEADGQSSLEMFLRTLLQMFE